MFAIITKTDRYIGTTAAATFGPVIILPCVAYLLFRHAPPWQVMWSLAITIYFSWKWQTFFALPSHHTTTTRRMLGYLLLWPGMNAAVFCDPQIRTIRPNLREWLFAIGKLSFGLILLFAVAPRSAGLHPLAVGWLCMFGLVFVLHFGLFHLLSLAWRQVGVDAEPIMNFPVLATSLSDFWGRRWNSAFRDLAFGQILRPMARRIGIEKATLLVFLVSGLIHELVISVPVHAGWGGPTIYFMTQGIGLLIERSQLGKKSGLSHGVMGRLFCGLCVVGPIGLLFHQPFVLHAILPTFAAMGVVER